MQLYEEYVLIRSLPIGKYMELTSTHTFTCLLKAINPLSQVGAARKER
jgi:hypothetical protein